MTDTKLPVSLAYGTYEGYQKIVEKDPNTLYIITDRDMFIFKDREYFALDNKVTRSSEKAVTSGAVFNAIEALGISEGIDADTLQGHDADYFATVEALSKKQDKIVGEEGQLVGFDSSGNMIAMDIEEVFQEITSEEVDTTWQSVEV